MAIITKPGTIEKGVQNIFTLNKADLLLNSMVSADTYYSDSANWNRVEVNYISSTGTQFKKVIFDATQVTPQGIFYASLKALDIFVVLNIQVYDFDGGVFTVENRTLNMAEFDIDMTPVVGLVWDTNASYSLGSNGSATKLDNSGTVLKSTAENKDSSLTPNYELEYTFNGYMSLNSQIGIALNGDLSSSGFSVQFDNSNNPFIRIIGSASFRFSAYALPNLNAGLNTIKIVRVSNSWGLNVNGTQVSIGSIGISSFMPSILLATTSEQVLSSNVLVP